MTGSACVPELIKDGIGCMRKRCLSCVGSALVLLQCHIALSDGASLGWCSEAYGIEWRTGHGDIFGRLPLLYGTAAGAAAFLIRRSSPLMFAGSLAGDGLLNAVRGYLAFGAAEQAAFALGDVLGKVFHICGGVACALLICYDVEFPEAVRKLARQQSGQTIAIHPDKAGDNSPGEPS